MGLARRGANTQWVLESADTVGDSRPRPCAGLGDEFSAIEQKSLEIVAHQVAIYCDLEMRKAPAQRRADERVKLLQPEAWTSHDRSRDEVPCSVEM